MKDQENKEADEKIVTTVPQQILQQMQTNLQQMQMFDDVLAVYKEVEWCKEVVIGSITYNYCPLCDQAQGRGHLESCSYFEVNKKVSAF